MLIFNLGRKTMCHSNLLVTNFDSVQPLSAKQHLVLLSSGFLQHIHLVVASWLCHTMVQWQCHVIFLEYFDSSKIKWQCFENIFSNYDLPMDFFLLMLGWPHQIASTKLDIETSPVFKLTTCLPISKYLFWTILGPTLSGSLTPSYNLIVCHWNWMIRGIIC